MRRLLQWLRKPAPPAHPALLRILDEEGRPVDAVSVRAEYFPSGRSIEEHRVTAQGLCIFGWPKLEDRIRLSVSSPEGSAFVEVGLARLNPERVIEVALRRAPSPT